MWLHNFSLFLLLLLQADSTCAGRTKDQIPRRTNIIIVVDVSKPNQAITQQHIAQVLKRTSLLRHRLSLYTTNGLKEKILKFQSRQCLINKLKSVASHHNRYSIHSVLRIAERFDIQSFPEDEFIILLFSDKQFRLQDAQALTQFSSYKKCQKIFVVNVGHSKNPIVGDIDNTDVINTKYNAGWLRRLPFVTELPRCKEGSHVKDECGRVCECFDGKLVNCYRVRKEFSSLTFAERERYIATYKKVSTSRQHKYAYEKYCHIHKHYFYKGIHNASQFFPWHRNYLLGYENLLQTVDCRVTIPVWNWAKFSSVAWNVTPSYHIWRNVGGFGGNGTYGNGYCVMNGHFQLGSWQPPLYENTRNIVSETCSQNKKCMRHCLQYIKCLRRRFTCTPPSYKLVKKNLRFSPHQFYRFDLIIRSSYHNKVHNCVGGHMQTIFASSAPEFWGHHAMLDSIWDVWQQKGEEYKWAAFTEKDAFLYGFKQTKRSLYIDNDNLAGCGIKIKYEIFDMKDLIEDENNFEEPEDFDGEEEFPSRNSAFQFDENGAYKVSDEEFQEEKDFHDSNL